MKTQQRATGLYKNGSRWWVRSVRGPLSGCNAPRSTGTSELKLANRVAGMLDDLAENRKQWDLLELAAAGELSLLTLYNHHSAGTLAGLREQRTAASVEDPDLEPHVGEWFTKHLKARVTGGELKEHQAEEYQRQVRALIPEGERFPRSQFVEDVVKEKLMALVDPNRGTALSSSTRRRYLAAWQLFYRYARKRVPLTINPFEERDWFPANASPRSTFWDYATARDVVDRMHGEARVFMALVFGSGIELGAALALKGKHVGKDDNERVLVAPGSKNEHREERTIFVTKWAWEILTAHAESYLPTAPLWSFGAKNRGKEVREEFYGAQVEAGLIDAPPVNKKTGKKLWAAVNPHRIHDARHSYCVIRLLGLDGEPRASLKDCSSNLGHADEQMVMKVYGKANIAARLKLIELREAREAGRAAAAAGAK